MKTRLKVLSVSAIVLTLLAGGVLYSTNGLDSAQGRFGGGGSITLFAASPSGDRSTAVVDEIFDFQVAATATAESVIPAGDTLNFVFQSKDRDLATVFADPSVSLSCDGTTVATGSVLPVSRVRAELALLMPSDFTVPVGDEAICTLIVNSSALLDEDAGVEDPLLVSLRYAGTVVTGNLLYY